MNPYISALRTHMEKTKFNYGDNDIHSLLEFLWRTYTEFNPINDQMIKDQFLTLRPILDKLSADDADNLFHTVCTLCMEHERLAFLEGIRVGAQLLMEMSNM